MQRRLAGARLRVVRDEPANQFGALYPAPPAAVLAVLGDEP